MPANSAERTMPLSRLVAYCLAIASVATAVIHFAVAGWLQLAWAVLAVARPSRAVLCGGAVLNANIIAIYLLTRTVGDMVGPTPGDVEPVGFGDLLCTVLEALILAGCFWLPHARAGRLVRRSQLV